MGGTQKYRSTHVSHCIGQPGNNIARSCYTFTSKPFVACAKAGAVGAEVICAAVRACVFDHNV